MTFRDSLVLVVARLRTRKKRTMITLFTTSLLFGVVLAIISGVSGIYRVVSEANRTVFGNTIYLRGGSAYGMTAEKRASINDYAAANGGKFIADGLSYQTAAGSSVLIDGFSVSSCVDPIGCSGGPGYRVQTLDKDGRTILAPFIKQTEERGDVIQILIPFRQAMEVTGLSQPSIADSPAEQRRKIERVNQAAVGKRLVGTFTQDGAARQVEYEIVGVLPLEELPTFNDFSPTILESFVRIVTPYYNHQTDPFIAVNPESSAFRELYKQPDDSVSVILAFEGVAGALGFMNSYPCLNNRTADCRPDVYAQDYLNSQFSSCQSYEASRGTLVIILVVITVIAALIMAGTINRVIDDERESIALYRTVGASSGDLYRIYFGYVVVLGLFGILVATLIGLLITGALTIFSTAHISANLAAFFNLPDLPNAIFIGWDPYILVVYAAILLTSLLGLVFVSPKIASKNQMRDLRG